MFRRTPIYSSSRVQRQRRIKTVLFVSLTLTLLGIICVGIHYLGSISGNPKDIYYDVVLDAGSTGTRIHVYKYHQMRLLSEVFDSTRPGLSSIADNPAKVDELLEPLMMTALREIPTKLHSGTPVRLMATAGLRLLNNSVCEQLLSAAKAHLQGYPFVLGGVSIITGDEEAVSAWFTVNYLIASLEPRTDRALESEQHKNGCADCVTTIDMGGASAQIVFPFQAKMVPENVRWQCISVVRFGEKDVLLYHHSFLGLGLKQMTQTLIRSITKEQRKDFACLPHGFQYKEEGQYGGLEIIVGGSHQSFESCARLIRHHVFERISTTNKAAFTELKNVFKRAVELPKFFLFSYFHDRLRQFGSSRTSHPTVGLYKVLGEELCGGATPEAASLNRGSMCMDMAYLYTFLSVGLGLPDETALAVEQKLDGVEISWTLGASLLSKTRV